MANRKRTGFIDGLGQALDGYLPTPGGVAKAMVGGTLNAGAAIIGMFRRGNDNVLELSPEMQRQLAAAVGLPYSDLTALSNLTIHDENSFSIYPTPQKVLGRTSWEQKIRDGLLTHLPDWELNTANTSGLTFTRVSPEELARRERFGGVLSAIAPSTMPEHGGTLIRLPDGYDDMTMRLQLIAAIEKNAPGMVFYGFPSPEYAEVGTEEGRKLHYGGRGAKLMTPKPMKTAELAAVIERDSAGYKLASYNPVTGIVVLAKIDPQTLAIRKNLAAILSAEPSDLEVTLHWAAQPQPRLSAVVLSTPVLDGIGDPSKRAALYEQLALTLPGGVEYRAHEERRANGIAVIFAAFDDPLNGVLRYPTSERPTLRSVPFAVDENGKTIRIGLLEGNCLLGGTPGSGKSGGATALLAGIAALPNVALIGLDPKRVELSLWRDRFSVIAKKEEDATTVLAATVEEMERRYEWLESAGLKKITETEISPTMPLLVLMIDELADLVSIGVTKPEKDAELERSTMIRRLIAKGRAAGIVVITATQKPQSDVIPTAMRDLIQQRVAYATTNAAMTDTILGAGMASNGGLAHNIAASEKGVCYIVNETSREPVRARTFWIADEDVAGVAASTAHNRVELPWMPIIAPAPTPTPPQPVVEEPSASAAPQRIVLPKPDQAVFNVWDSRLAVPNIPSAPVVPVERASISPEELFTPPAEADAVEAPAQSTAFIGTPLEREMERRNALLDEVAALYPPGSEVPVFVAPEVEPLSPEVQLPPARRKKTEPPRIDWGVPPNAGGAS